MARHSRRKNCMSPVKKKTPLSARHLEGIKLFLWHTKSAERAENRTQYEAYVMATVISAFSFLDGEINNFFNSASNLNKIEYGEKGRKFGLSFEAKARFHYWMENKREELRGMNALDTAQLALRIAGENKFNEGKGIYQKTDIVRILRNQFVHHTPEFRPAGGASTDYDLNRDLESYVEDSPLASLGDPDFPDKKLSYDCALWCSKQCIEFSNQFRNKVNWKITNKDTREEILGEY